MERRINFIIVLIFILNISCKTNDPTTDINNSDPINYWEKNTLKHMNLKGSVKTIITTTDGNTETLQFNAKGFISSVSVGNMYLCNYEYNTNNNLIKTTQVITFFSAETTITTYEYKNFGKYIPMDIYNLPIDIYKYSSLYIPTLVSNLSAAIISDNERKDYVIKNDTTLYLINTRPNLNNTKILKDTAIIKYKGSYPISFDFKSIDGSTVKGENITYYSNGMFATYKQNMIRYGNLYNNSYNFLSNDFTLIPSTITISNGNYPEQYLYNELYDLLSDKLLVGNNLSEQEITEYSSYIYDINKNWISRIKKFKRMGSQTYDSAVTETRKITYW